LEVLEILTPVMSVTTLLLSLATEQLWHVLPSSPYFNNVAHVLVTMLLILTGALIAFLMVWAEYQVGWWLCVAAAVVADTPGCLVACLPCS
jgi:hypothetical protein